MLLEFAIPATSKQGHFYYSKLNSIFFRLTVLKGIRLIVPPYTKAIRCFMNYLAAFCRLETQIGVFWKLYC